MWLVDTNVLSEIRKGTRCNANVARWVRETDPDTMFISVLVLGEIRRGIERLRRKDPKQAKNIDEWHQRLRLAFAGRILDVTEPIAELWGRDSVEPIPVVDALLAATAKANGFVFVTRNAADVKKTGVECFNPFSK